MATGCSTRRKGSMPNISRSSSRLSVRSSTRMKKVAAPPPPPLKKQVSSNGKSSHDTPMTTTPGEDCAIDELLEGRMDLNVILPDCSRIKMTVDRRMAMMDLLVQVSTANKISAAGHIINVGSKDENSIHYKPNTPIGSLDTNTVYIIPKPVADLPIRKMPKLANQPFEQTFRLQVNLPRNQRMVLRVSPHSTLAEVKQQICMEKDLNHSTHHLVHPAHPETVLDLNSTLELYGYAEISLMSNSSLRDSIRSTSTNFIAYQRPEEEKRKKGILGLFSRKKKGMSLDASSNGVNSRGVSPARSELSVRSSYQPKQSTKRKPAPAPPPVPAGPSPSPPLVIQCSKTIDSQTESEVSVKTDEMGSTVSHSRHSSDSSGYHEPSVFSDCSENKSPDASVVHGSHALTAPESPRPKDHRELHSQKKRSSTPIKESTNLNSIASYSSVSISSTLRKRKAPQPPVPPPLPEAPKESPTSETAPVEEMPAIDPSESAEPLQKGLSSQGVDQNNGSQSACAETVVDHQPDEMNATVSCDSTTPASPNPSVSTVTQPCTSSCSEDATVLKENEDRSAADLDKTNNIFGLPTSPPPEFQDALACNHDSDGTDAANTGGTSSSCSSCHTTNVIQGGPLDLPTNQRTVPVPQPRLSVKRRAPSPVELKTAAARRQLSYELCSSKEPDSGSQENTDDVVQPSLKELAEEDAVFVEQEQLQYSSEEALDNIPPSSHSEIETTMAVLDVVIDEQLESQQLSAVDCQVKSEKSELNTSEEKAEISHDTSEGKAESSHDASEVPIPFSSQSTQEEDVKCFDQNSLVVVVETDHLQSTDVPLDENKPASSPNLTKLPNFTLGCYQTINEDIYDSETSEKHVTDIHLTKEYNGQPQSIKSGDANVVNKNDVMLDSNSLGRPEIIYAQKRKALDVKIMSFKEREKENPHQLVTKGQVQEKRAQFTGLGTQSLGGRSASLHNLTPKKKIVREIMSSEDDVESVSALYRTQSDQNVAQENSEVDEKQAAFMQEQKRLYEEYQKLQAQFITWQKQLMNNQSLLQNEQIMPKIVFPTFNDIENNLHDAQGVEQEEQENEVKSAVPHRVREKNNVEELKTRSLPRPKPRPLSLKELPRVRSVTPPPSLVEISERCVVADIHEAPPVAKNKISLGKSGEFQRTSVQDESPKLTKDDLCKLPNSSESDDRISPDVIYEEVKSQTLPRPKPKPQTNGAFTESQTMTLNRHTRPKSQVVSITIGSWQQRNESVKDIDSSSVASVRSKFQSLENILQGTSKSSASVTQETTKTSTSVVASEKKSPASKPPVPDKGADVNIKTFQPVDKEKHPKSIQKAGLTRHAPKTEKLSKTESLSQSRYPKPLIKLTSMKDDFHLPSSSSLRTCHKWPLGEMNQKESTGIDILRDELKISAKAPSGVVREKIHRAEVDLRHHSKKDGKVSSDTHPMHKEADLRRVSSKSEPGWTQKKYKESDLRQSKSETIPSDPKGIESCSKSESLPRSEPSTSQSSSSSKGAPAVRPTKLHITTVSIHNTENAQGTTPPEVKSPRTPKMLYGSLKYEGEESKLRTMAELKSVLAQKSAEKEEANRKSQTGEAESSSASVNGSVPPPPPPPPPTSAMPVIPPAAPIPVSSQLVMGKQAKSTATVKRESTKQPKIRESKDPREELMLEIRGFGGRQALRKFFQRPSFLKRSPKKKTSAKDSFSTP